MSQKWTPKEAIFRTEIDWDKDPLKIIEWMEMHKKEVVPVKPNVFWRYEDKDCRAVHHHVFLYMVNFYLSVFMCVLLGIKNVRGKKKKVSKSRQQVFSVGWGGKVGVSIREKCHKVQLKQSWGINLDIHEASVLNLHWGWEMTNGGRWKHGISV